MDNKHKGNNEIKKIVPNEKDLNRKFKEGKVEIVKKPGVERESKAANAEKVATKLKNNMKGISLRLDRRREENIDR